MTCTQQSGTCTNCRSGCTRKPGWFLPGEAEKAAEFLGITLEDFFDQYLAVDWWVSEPDIFVLSPALAGETPGQEFPGDPRGTCVFYENNRCRIHPVKPHECAQTWCGASSGTVHGDIADAWKTQQDQITQILGREPVSADFGLSDLLG